MKETNDGETVRMFQRNDQNYLINQIPRFNLFYENLEQLSYYDELIDVRSKEEYFLDHLKRPEVHIIKFMDITY